MKGKTTFIVLTIAVFLISTAMVFAPGFGDPSPDTGTPDSGTIVNSTAGSNYVDGNFTSTQSNDNTYFTVGRNNPGGVNDDLEAYINLTYNLTPINIQPRQIVQLIFNISYCQTRDVTAPSTCGGSSAQGTTNTMDVEIYNWSSGTYIDIGDITEDDEETTRTYYVNSTFSDFVNSTNNLVNIRYEVNYTIINNNNDAVFSIDYAPLTVKYDNTTPVVTLNSPVNGFNTTLANITTNFTVTDNNVSLSCSLYLNNVVNQTNASVINNTLTNFVLNNLGHGSYNWAVNCTDIGNTVAATRSFFVNRTPTLPSINDSPDPIKGGNVITISASADVEDPNNDTLNFYCATNTTPTASNTLCTGGSTVDTTPPYALNCTFVTAATDTANTVYCRAYDSESYSTVRNTTYTTDSTAPSTTIASVANDSSSPYFDILNDGSANITVNGEASMQCRYSTSDIAYSSMSNDCSIAGSQAFCSATTLTQGNYTIYVSCRDAVGNEQNATNNLNVAFTLDYTAPTTSDNALTSIQLPGYNVTITESDNIDGDPDTLYCTDTTNTCTSNTAIDNGGRVTFNSRGTFYLRYNSTDDAGNSQAIQSRTITINSLPALTSAADNAVTIKGGSIVNITTVSSSSDSGQNITLFVCKTDSANSSGCSNSTNNYCSANGTANASCTFTAEGDDAEHTWYAFVFDESNESAGGSKSGSYITDSTAPSITISSPANTTLSQSSATAEIVINEAGNVASYCLDVCASNTTLTKVSSTLFTASLSGLSNGAHTITFYVNDTVGNLANTTRTFTVDTTLQDTTAPTITTRSPLNGTYLNTTSILLNITSDESLSSAEYSMNGTAFQQLVNYTGTQWNRTITINEGPHNVTFRGNDTSGNRNQGNSPVVFFFVDVTAPQNSTIGFSPSSINDSSSITCFSSWTDNVALDIGFIEYNVSGSFTNSTNTTFNGTLSGSLNITFAANASLGSIGCRFYAYDKAGNLNRTSIITAAITDVTNPASNNFSYIPNATSDLDPNVRVNASINATDNRAISSVVFQYRRTNETVNVTNVTMTLLSGNRYNASVAFAEGNWTFGINMTDASNNSIIAGETNISVFSDETFLNTTTILAIKSFVLSERASNNSLGNITINNTADFNLTFVITASSSGNRITLNGTGNTSFTLANASSAATQAITVEANTTNLSAGIYNYSIYIEARRNPVVGTSNLSFQLSIQNVAGPLLDASIDTFDSNVTLGETVDFASSVTNFGTSDATGVHLTWGIPENWSLVSGNITRGIGTLAPGVKATNSIKVSISGSNGTYTVNATANSTEGSIDTDSKTISVGEVAVVTETVTQTVTQTVSTGGGGSGGGVRIFAIDLYHIPKFVLQKKETAGFTVNVTNPNRLTRLVNITLSAEGYPQSLITVSPETADIEFNRTAQFFVSIRAPNYMEAGDYTLDLNVKAVAATVSEMKILEKSSKMILVVQEINGTEAKKSIIDAESIIAGLRSDGLESRTISELMEKARRAVEGEEYDLVGQLVARIKEIKNELQEAKKVLKDVELKIQEAEFNGIEISETRKLYDLALAAFGREDYSRAIERANNALLTYPLETRGKINYIKLIQNWWWALLLTAFFTIYSGFLGYRRLMLFALAKRLEWLHREEATIRDLLEKVRNNYFINKSIGRIEYHRSVYEYEKRLAKVKRNIIKMISRRVGLLNFEEATKGFCEEEQRVVEAIKDAQRKYFELGTLTKSNYEKTMQALKSERAEITRAIEIAKSRDAEVRKSRLHRLIQYTSDMFNLLIKIQEKVGYQIRAGLASVFAKMPAALKVFARLLPHKRSLRKVRFGYYDINKGWQAETTRKTAYHAKNLMYKIMPAVLLIIITFSFFMLGSSITGLVTNSRSPVENALSSIREAELAVSELHILGFRTEKANDTLTEARLSYEKSDYIKADELSLSVVAIKEKVLSLDKQIDRFDVRLYESEKNGTNASAAMILFNSAVQAFENEEYEKSEELLQEAASVLSDIETEEARQRALQKAEFDTVKFLRHNWHYIFAASLLFALVSLLIYRRLEIKLAVRRLHRLEQEKDVTEDLMRELQKKYFERAVIGKSDYETARRRYERRLIKLKKDIPLLKDNVMYLSKRRL